MSSSLGHHSFLSVALAPGAVFSSQGTPTITLKDREWPLPIEEHWAAWHDVADGTIDYEVVLDKLSEGNLSSHHIATFINTVQQAMALGWLEYRIISNGKILAKLRPIGKLLHNPLSKALMPKVLTPSRFTTTRMEADFILAKNSRFGHALDIYDPTLLINLFSVHRNLIEDKTKQLFVKFAYASGTLIDEESALLEQTPGLGFWEAHELDFHNQSRLGNNLNPVGGVFSWKGKVPSLPALKAPDISRLTVKLPSAHDLPSLSLNDVINLRKSIREHGDRCMTLQDLSNFLWHSLRVKEVLEPNEATGLFYEASIRPYPCGGAAYELEVYIATLGFDGLNAGVWWYDPMNHSLELRSDKSNLIDGLLQTASISAAGSGIPEVLLLITSRLGRLSWKYRSISYAVTLKHTGVLYQTFYMIATALGLAPCGLGAGNSVLANLATDTDPNDEASVGEFMLGGPLKKAN